VSADTGYLAGIALPMIIFAAAGSGAHGPPLLADRVSAALSGAGVFLALALIVTLIARPRRRGGARARLDREPAGTENHSRAGAEAPAETRAA
jgi:hypothetical protein